MKTPAIALLPFLLIVGSLALTGCAAAKVVDEDGAHGTANASTYDLSQLAALITAIGALGAAAFSLVDATKARGGGGVSKVGYAELSLTLQRFAPALEQALGKTEQGELIWQQVVFAHWINGRPRDEQKGIVKSLIRLGLTPITAAAIAGPAHVSPQALSAVATKLDDGQELTPADLNVLGRMDASVEAQLDAAFDRADQRYRNVARVLAGVFSVALALLAAFALGRLENWEEGCGAILVGLLAVPLAPVAKDLASSLQAAAAALRATK